MEKTGSHPAVATPPHNCRACQALLPRNMTVGGSCPACGSQDGGDASAHVSLMGAGEVAGQQAIEERLQQVLARPELASRYRIVRKIGQGGMGALFMATDTELGRNVALKLTLGTDEEMLARFQREGLALARLSHPNVLTVYGVEVCDGVPILVLELLSGCSLASSLRLLGAYPMTKALELASLVLEGLAAAHEAGIAHRDLKPANVLLLHTGGLKLLDFGLARGTGPGLSAPFTTSLTGDGVTVGTVGYISPEQWCGEKGDARSDVFAMGLMLFELLTGDLPPALSDPRIWLRRGGPHPLEEDLKRAGLAAPLTALLRRALEMEAARRFPHARAMALELDRVRQALDPAARDTSPPVAPEGVADDGTPEGSRRTAPGSALPGDQADVRPLGLAVGGALLATLALAALVALRPGAAPAVSASRSESASPSASSSAVGSTTASASPSAPQSSPAAPPGIDELLMGMRLYSGDLWQRDRAPLQAATWFYKSARAGNAVGAWWLYIFLASGTDLPKDETEALVWLKKAAAGGVPGAQRMLGSLHQFGQGVPRDPVEAVRWYRLAADRGNPEALNDLGQCYLQGMGVARDPAQAVRHFRQAAGLGLTPALGNLGYCFFTGTGVTQDRSQAADWFRRAAERGDTTAILNLAEAHRLGRGVPKDPGLAVTLTRQAAEFGNASAQVSYANYLLNGEGGAPDANQAFVWFKKAAEQGDPDGCHLLSWLYEQGLGCAPDQEEALKWCRKALELKVPNAFSHIGHCYLSGKGVPLDPVEAARLFRQGAALGSPRAQYSLAELYRTGLGVMRDPSQAVHFYRLAAEQVPAAMLRLGWCYALGEGVAVDLTRARFCYARAAETGLETTPMAVTLEKQRAIAEAVAVGAELDFPEARFLHAQLLERGDGVSKDIEMAVDHYRKAARAGHAGASARLKALGRDR